MMKKLTSTSDRHDIDWYLRQLARSPWAYHIDDDPTDIQWQEAIPADTLKVIIHNRQVMVNHPTVGWDLIWSMYHQHWKRFHREQRVTREVQRLLEQYGLVDSAIFDDQDDRDAEITEDWTTCILDAMNNYDG